MLRHKIKRLGVHICYFYQQALFISVGDDRKKEKRVGPLTGYQTALSVCASNARAPQPRFMKKHNFSLGIIVFINKYREADYPIS